VVTEVTQCREETSHVLQRSDLADPQSSRRLETLKITLSGAGGAKGKLLIEWENVTASAPFTVK
jgi:hypothetical protein